MSLKKMLTTNKKDITNNSSRIVLIALNKPKGVICTHHDEFNRRKALDFIPKSFYKSFKGRKR